MKSLRVCVHSKTPRILLINAPLSLYCSHLQDPLFLFFLRHYLAKTFFRQIPPTSRREFRSRALGHLHTSKRRGEEEEEEERADGNPFSGGSLSLTIFPCCTYRLKRTQVFNPRRVLHSNATPRKFIERNKTGMNKEVGKAPYPPC